MTRTRLGLLLLVLVLVSAQARAQDDYDDPDDDDSELPGSAALSLHFDKLGGASVGFGLPERPGNWETIRQSLAATLHCPAQNFIPPFLDRGTQDMVSGWPADRRDKYLDYFAGYQRRQLIAKCGSLLGWNGSGRSGSIELSALIPQLKQAGIQQLWVSISYPPAKSIEYSKQNLSYPPQNGLRFFTYQLATDSPRPAPIRISFGLGRRGLYGSIATALAFVLFPVAVTLYMRRAALVSGKLDPTAAWFSYFRTINWCINGAMLLWITSGLGARQSVQDSITYAIAPGWIATLLDVFVVIGPAFLVYLACVAVSYPLHVHLRGSTWTRREFLLQQSVNVGAQALPLMFFLAAAANFSKSGSVASIFFVMALLSFFVFRSLKMRVGKSYPHALTRGELRDRVFTLASKAGVSISQIFVLPTGKSQVANAYASGNRVVMFTDYLLQHLTKREVEGVAAHEIAHIQLGHVGKRALTFYAALILPGLLSGFIQGFIHSNSRGRTSAVGAIGHAYAAATWFWQWSQRDFILMLLALLVFYCVSRRFEYAADERGAELTGDAESQISGLLKLSRLNLMPIQWGKGTGTWLTHPSMVRRAERIAASSGMPADQLQAILERHRMEVQGGPHAAPASDDHYAIPEATDPEHLASAAKKHGSHQFKLWTSLLMHVVPPALFALAVHGFDLQGNPAVLVYFIGAVLTPILSITYSAVLGVQGRHAEKVRLADRFRRNGVSVGDTSIAVGFSPGAVVRFYGTNYYNWDIGLLDLSDTGLSYHGEQIQFSISPTQIDGICIGQGGPSWWRFPRIYIRWKGTDGRPSVFSIANLEPCSIRELRRRTDALFAHLNQWRSSSMGLRSHSDSLQVPPGINEITSRLPREFGGLKISLTLAIYLVPLAMAVNAVLRIDSLWYILSAVALTRLLESVPFWRFHDRLLDFSTQRPEIAVAAKASDH